MTTYPSDIPYNYGLALASDLDYITPMMNEIRERNEKMIANHTAPQPALSPKFVLDLNLDDLDELLLFLDKIKCAGPGDRLQAVTVGLVGPGSVRAFRALRAYARNKLVAIQLRSQGESSRALSYESICNRIYARDIRPNIECW